MNSVTGALTAFVRELLVAAVVVGCSALMSPAAWAAMPGEATAIGGASQLVPGAGQVVPGTTVLLGVDCSSATFCQAVGDASASQGVIVPITDGLPGVATVISDVTLNAVSCPSATLCEAVGQTASPSVLPSLFPPPPLTSEGVVVSITDGVFGVAQSVPTTGRLLSVSCPTVNVCQTVGITDGGDAVMVEIANGVPGAVTTSPGSELVSISCASATLCEAVGASFATGGGAEVVPIVDGTRGTAQIVPETFEFNGVSCPSVSMCEAVGWGDVSNGSAGGVLATIVNGTVGTAQPDPDAGTFVAVSCSSPGNCLATDVSGGGTADDLVSISDGVPALPQVLASPRIDAVSCPSATVCEAAGLTASGQGAVVTIADNIVIVTVSGTQTFGSSSPSFSTSTSPPAGASFSGTLTCDSVGDPATPISPTLPVGTYTVDGSSCSGLTLTGPTASDHLIEYSDGLFTVNEPATAATTTTTAPTSPARTAVAPVPTLPVTGESTATPLTEAAALIILVLGACKLHRRHRVG